MSPIFFYFQIQQTSGGNFVPKVQLSKAALTQIQACVHSGDFPNLKRATLPHKTAAAAAAEYSCRLHFSSALLEELYDIRGVPQ